jgi:hypothetical protein
MRRNKTADWPFHNFMGTPYWDDIIESIVSRFCVMVNGASSQCTVTGSEGVSGLACAAIFSNTHAQSRAVDSPWVFPHFSCNDIRKFHRAFQHLPAVSFGNTKRFCSPL